MKIEKLLTIINEKLEIVVQFLNSPDINSGNLNNAETSNSAGAS